MKRQSQAYEKAKADSSRIAYVPMWVYDDTGGIEKESLQLLLIGWLLGGAVITGDKRVKTPKGTVTIRQGETWGSRYSMMDDLLASVGKEFSYAQVRYAMQKAAKNGYVEDCGLVHPETRGKYGKRYRLDDNIIFPEKDEYVNIVKAYQMFHYGDPEKFTLGEAVVGDVTKGYASRDKYVNQHKWTNYIAERGIAKPAFTTVGRWRPGDQGDEDSPVLVPYVTFDIDREDIIEAYHDALTVTQRLKMDGYDLERVYVSYSGRRGFHIQISIDQFGTPIFADAKAARETIRELTKDVFDGIEFDPSVTSPLKLIRVSGSQHEKTGNYKQTVIGTDFLDLSPQEMLDGLKKPKSFTFADPIEGETQQTIVGRFQDAANRAQKRLMKVRRKRKRIEKRTKGKPKPTGIGSIIGRIIEGVAEREQWDEKYAGRNWAAYILACWLLERPQKDMEWAYDKLLSWDKLNDPPMQNDPEEMEGLQKTFESAVRTVFGKTKGNTSRYN